MIDGRLVLPGDVRLDPVDSLPPATLAGFEFAPGEYAVTRPRSRTPTHIVSEPTVRLLRIFREPMAIADAVIRFGKENSADPAGVLDAAFPMLQTLVKAGLLVPADSQLAPSIEFLLARGEEVGDLVIDEPIAVIVDNEVYRAHTADGLRWAVKIARPGAEARLTPALHHEAAILKRLDGASSPRLLREGVHSGRAFIAMEWCPGVDVLAASELIRGDASSAERELTDLALAVLEAYVRLHAIGVVHGDVHPRNLLLDARGTVRVIDFGQAHLIEEGESGAGPGRGVVDLYMEPELARARLSGESSPPPTFAGEQYSVAAVVYLVLCGAHTHDFVLEQRRMLHQVRDEEPMSLQERGLPGFEHSEAVLRKALAKRPEDRFASLRDFHHALQRAFADDERATGASPRLRPGRASARDLLLREFLERSALDGRLLAQGLGPPVASLNLGAAGLAMALLRIAQQRSDASLLATADVWSQHAVMAERTSSADAFWAPALELDPKLVGDVSLFHSRPGVSCAAALVADAQAEPVRRQDAVERFVASISAEEPRTELVFGLAGSLLGCGLLLDAVGPAGEASATLRSAGTALSDTILERLERLPAIGSGEDSSLLGVAHGHAGVLYGLLQWTLVTGGTVSPPVHARLEQLAALAQPTGRGVGWAVSAHRRRGLDGMRATWCNGAAGHAHLWLLAHELTEDPRHVDLATDAAWTCFEAERAAADLCCGSAGRAYALLRLFRHTCDPAWLSRANDLADHAAATIRSRHLRQNSLYRGEAGVCVLLSDLTEPENARMPMFELSR